MVLFTHPTGNANVRNAALALAEADLLGEFLTTLAIFEDAFSGTAALLPGFSELQRRQYPDALKPFTRLRPVRECLRLACLRLGLDWPVRQGRGPLSIDAVYRDLDRSAAARLRRIRFRAAYCYEDGALETFRVAGKSGASRLYDLPIGYWRASRRILAEEAEINPEWAPTLGGLADSREKLSRKDEELGMADHIFVASSFTRATLAESPFPIAPVSVVPYGCGNRVFQKDPGSHARHQPLRVLFVGSLGQRKGISYLLEAIHLLGSSASLTLIGRRPARSCPALDAALLAHRWIPALPNDGILREMARHDVLVFPSLFEGFGLVVSEALSQGLPVVTTAHTCGPDILSDGVDGFIVALRDAAAIAGKLELLHRDRDKLRAMSLAASEKARSLAWQGYRDKLAGEVCKLVK